MEQPSASITGLGQVALRITDLDRAVAFYRDVFGLRLLARFDPPGIAFFDLGGPRLMLEKTAPPTRLYLRSDDVDATIARLRAAGVVVESEPHAVHRDDEGLFGPAGETELLAFVRDSEDNVIGISGRRPQEETGS